MRRVLLVFALLAFACSSTTTVPAPSPSAEAPSPAPPPAPATALWVTAPVLNVRAAPSTSADVVTQLRRGTRVLMTETTQEWAKVRLADGQEGWVSRDYVSASAALPPTRRAGGCPPDSDFSFAVTPKPRAYEPSLSPKHGLVVVEATVDARGEVTSTRIVQNTTGDPDLGSQTEREIRAAKFQPPVRNCAARGFIYTYKRSF